MGNLRRFNEQNGKAATQEVACCICSRPSSPYAVDYNGNSIARCARCGLRFVSPRPPFEALVKFVYDDRYYGGEDPREKNDKDYEYYLGRIQRLRPGPGVWLDVGAGDGTLLEKAQKNGWTVEGLEIESSQIDYLRKHLSCTVHCGMVEDLDFTARYDVITAIHVLEHTLDPRSFLLKCKTLLKPGGVAYLIMPNTASLNDSIKSGLSFWNLKSKGWKHLAADHHLWFFTVPTLERLCAAIEFPVVSAETLYPRAKLQRSMAAPLLRAAEKRGLAPWTELALKRGSV